jgi:hypothetical protein
VLLGWIRDWVFDGLVFSRLTPINIVAMGKDKRTASTRGGILLDQILPFDDLEGVCDSAQIHGPAETANLSAHAANTETKRYWAGGLDLKLDTPTVT